MVIFLVVLILVCLWKIRFSGFHSEYMGILQTRSVKGLFIALVLLSHASSYLEIGGGIGDRVYLLALQRIGQLMVAMFLFYSGFGVMESYKCKDGYEKTFLKNRVIKTLLHFDVALVLFLLVDIMVDISYPIGNYFECWIGWKTVGNSNWYIFVILILYIVTWCAFWICRKLQLKPKWVEFFVIFFSIGAWFFLYMTKEPYWYNTLLCYCTGMVYSSFKQIIDQKLRNRRTYTVCFLVLVALFYLLYIQNSVVSYSLCACVFALIITLLTMKVQVNNVILQFLGKYLFPIFILQRIPMIIMSSLGITNSFLFTIVAVMVTIPMAVIFDKGMNGLDKYLFNRS